MEKELEQPEGAFEQSGGAGALADSVAAFASNTEEVAQKQLRSEGLTAEPLTGLPSEQSRFASVADLENAYRELRAEFTRKSQRLGQLEQEIGRGKNGSDEQTGKGQSAAAASLNVSLNSELAPSAPRPRFAQQPAPGQPAQITGEALQNRGSSKIIEEYLLSVAASKKAPAVIANGGIDFVPIVQAAKKSVAAMTKEVENFFMRKERINDK